MYVERAKGRTSYLPNGDLSEVFVGDDRVYVTVVSTPTQHRRTESKVVSSEVIPGRDDARSVVEDFTITDSGITSPSRRVAIDGVRFKGSNDDAFWAHVNYWRGRSVAADKKSGVYETLKTLTAVPTIGSGMALLGTGFIYGTSYFMENADHPTWALIGMGITALTTAGGGALTGYFSRRVGIGSHYRDNALAAKGTIGKSRIKSVKS